MNILKYFRKEGDNIHLFHKYLIVKENDKCELEKCMVCGKERWIEKFIERSPKMALWLIKNYFKLNKFMDIKFHPLGFIFPNMIAWEVGYKIS
ncbi:MAG: hypothetical protein A2Y34_03960 [Spirochaetes bacterium GWC1_27_15]|nr:MAG: hypothetical protein A2Y34_03960 [Spirochaetes bacterium GWC1_27_15]